MVNNSSNINKTKESLNSNGQQFHQYQQNKRKFKQKWSTIPPISTQQSGIVDHHCLNFLCCVDICGIVDHYCLNFLCCVDICGIVDHYSLNFLCCVDIGGIVDHYCLNFTTKKV
jgi:hypothetical protein